MVNKLLFMLQKSAPESLPENMDETLKTIVEDRFATNDLVTVKWLADKGQTSIKQSRKLVNGFLSLLSLIASGFR